MSDERQRVERAFLHQAPDRTPLFEIFWPYQPIYWDVAGRNLATDMALAWDAMADGVAWDEITEAQAKADLAMLEFFELDMVHVEYGLPRAYPRPQKTGPRTWKLNGRDYHWDDHIHLVVPTHTRPEDGNDILAGRTEEEFEQQVRAQADQPLPAADTDLLARFDRLQQLAAQRGRHPVYMAEVGCGTAAAQYPVCMWMWMMEDPELYNHWLKRKKAYGMAMTEEYLKRGATVVALGGDVSTDNGPMISPALYTEFVLPVIREQVDLVHRHGARAVYTSDGNHWKIKQELFFDSGVDGYKEVDYAAGMTLPRLIAEGVKDRITIIGNVDARHTLCLGTPDQVRAHTRACLDEGLKSPGGHILHTSHSVHEGVPVDQYYAMWNAYRRYFGLPEKARP